MVAFAQVETWNFTKYKFLKLAY